MTTLEDEKEESELLIPPSWDEVEADEEYQALSPMKRQVVLSNWTQAVNNYARATGEYEADPEAGRAVADFAKRKTSEFSQNFDAAVESGLYEDNLWGGAKRLGDRAAIGVMQIAPASVAFANRTAELALDYVPQAITGLVDAVGLNKLSPIESVREKGVTQSFREFNAPLRETLRASADVAQEELKQMGAAGAALGGGFTGEVVQEVPKAAAEAVQDMIFAIGSGGASVATSLARPFAAAMRSLNVSSILSGTRSAVSTLDTAEAQYMQEDPTLPREQARMKALPEALTSGASTALVTRLGGFTGIESVLMQGGPKALRGRVLEVIKQSASEGLEEATDQSLQDLSERFYRNPEKAWADTYKELAMAYTLGSVLGGGFSAVSQTMSAVAENAKANDAPQTAAVLRQRAEQEAAIRTAKLFGDENAAKEAEDLEKEILGDLESEDGMDDTNEDGAPAGDGNVSGATGVISGDTTSTGTEGQTTTPAPTLRESVIASGIPEDAADAYISNLQAEGLADEQIQEIADNTRALREEAAKKNEADAEARREVARRARAGDPEARAQLERERGINVTTSEPTVTTPEPEPQSQEPSRQFVDLGGPAPQFQGGTNLLTGQPETPTLLAPEISPQQTPTTPTTTEGGEVNEEIQLRNQEGRQGRGPEGLTTTPNDSGAGAEGDVATPPPTEAPAPLSKLQAKRNVDPEDFDNSDPETQLSDLPANEAIDLLRQVGSTYEAPPVEGDETFGDYLQRTGVSVYDFDNRPTVLNEQERRYVPQGPDPFQGLIDLAAGRATPADFTVAQAPVSDITPEEAERRRKAQETEDFYRRNQQQAPEPKAPERPQITPQQIVQAPVKMAGDKGAVSNKRLPVREVPTGEVDERGAPVVRVVPGFVNDSNTMAEVLDKNQGVERVYVPAEEVANLDPEDIFVQYDENGAYVVAARHTKYGVIYADTGLTEDGVSLAALHEPTRQKNSQAQIQGKRATRLAKQAGVSVDEVAIPEMTDKFTERVSRAPVSKEEQEKPQEVARMLQRIQDRALALSGETVTTNDGRTVTIDAELADRIGIAATNLYLARLRGVDRKGKFKDAGGVVADIKKKVVAKLQKRAGTRAGFSLDQAVGDGDTTMGDLVGQTDQNLDSMGYADVPLNETDERGLENLATTEAGPQQDPNTQAAQADTPTPGPTTRSGAAVQTGPVTREEIPSYDDVATQATSEAEAELQAQDAEKGTKYFEVWKETLAMMQRGVKKKDLTPTRQRVVKEMEGKIRERMRDLISARTYVPDTKKPKAKLAPAQTATGDPRTLTQRNVDQLIDWNGGPRQPSYDIKRVLAGIADDPTQNQLVRLFARFLANSNVDFSGVRFEPIGDPNQEKDFIGRYYAGETAKTGTIQINVGHFHHGGSIARTVVHEALHHVAYHKLRPSYKRSALEQSAYRDLNKILAHVRGLVMEPERGETSDETAARMFEGDSVFYGLTDLDELFTETLTNTRFAVWMSTQAPLPDIRMKNTNLFRNLYEQVKQLFKNFIVGQEVRQGSLLSQAMDNILALAQDPQDDAKIQDYKQGSPKDAKKVAASLNAAAVDTPLGFQFKTQQAIRGMLNPNKRGELKGLTASPDGMVPWENLRAKITKAFSAEEADMVLPALESMVRQGRVNVAAAGEALQTIADAKARITVLSAENAETDQTRSGIIHQLDSMYPGWEQDEAQYIEDPIFMGLRDELDSMDRGKIQETESATARFKQVNPKPLDEMDEAGDIVVQDSGKKVFEEAMHFPTRKNVIGFGRKYTETLPNGEKATFVFEVQSDWAGKVRKAKEINASVNSRSWDMNNPADRAAIDSFRDDNGNPLSLRTQRLLEETASPLLSVYENLVLKAAIQEALAKGHTKLIITDAETAMMTEQHDKYAAPAAWYVVNGESATYRNTKEAAEKEVAQLRAAPIEDGGNPNARLEYREAGRPTQEPGMRAAYDPANGRLHNIMRKMTGDRGQRVDLGRHQNISGVPNEAVGNELGEIQRRFDADEITADQMNQQMRELRKANPIGSPVFKNPDGTPKTNITGIVYDLTPILENQEKVRALFAAPVNPSATPNPRAAKVGMMVQEEIPALGGTTVRSANLNGHPAQARFDQNGQPEIVYDPLAIATEVEGLDDSEARSVIRKLLGHEQAHVAGLINDYGTADAQGRTGREKIEAFHDEVMTPEMRQDVADSYVRRLDGMTDEDYTQAKAEFLADKAAVVGEFKRMFLERHLTGESYEDSLAALERKTGNKFGDLVRAIADYIVGRIRMLQTRFEMTKDPRLAAEILADRRMLENLNTGTNGLVGDRVVGVQEGAALNASRAQIRRMKQTSAGWKASGWLGQGLWDMQVWNRMKQKDAEISGANYRVEETAKKFNRLVKKHSPNAQLLRDALGTTENKLTDAQYDQWQKLKRAAQKETDPVKRQTALAAADNFRIAQVRTNVAAFKAVQQNALNQLPQELRDTVKTMRQDIDRLSQTMLAKGMVGANLQTTIGDNLEVYLNRSYEVFDNPEWSDFILSDQSPESQRIRNNAARLFRSQLVAEEARRIRRNAKLNNQPVPTRQQALATAQATVRPNDVSILMQDYLRVGDDAAVAILGGRLPGKKDTSILKLRGQIPQEIRELWGEYKDSGVNYAKSYLKMARFIANHNFQTDFLDMGLNRPTTFLWKEGVSQGQRPPHWVEIYKGMNDSPNPNPMAGVYGPPIIAEAFKELQQTYKSNLPMQWVAGLTGMAMASKTIYNPPQTYVRNFFGNGFIMTSQGYLTKDLDQLGFFKRFGGSMATTGERLVGIQRERSDQVVDYIERMISLGIMGDNVKANVIKELTSVVFDRDPKNAFNEKLASVFQMGKAVNDRLVDAYSAGDDFWKILAFESERSTFAQAYPNATPEALDRMAADRVRDVVPTYSKIPKFVSDIIKKQPYLAPYISWTSEIIRTTLNTYRHGVQDVRSGNPALMKSGAIRLISASATHALLLTVGGTLRNMFGLDEEDEAALRRFLPDWQVDALLVLTGKNDGKISFWDFSYLNPFDVVTEPFIAMGREAEQGGSALDVAAKGVEKAMAPWTGEQLLFGAFLDVARGYTKEGIPLYNDADSFYNNAKKGADRLIGSLTPGAINLASRIYKSLQGEVSPSGKVYKLEDEIKGAAFGQRPAEIDVVQVFQSRKVGAFNRMMESASDLATKEFRIKGTADLAKIKENYTQSNDARLKAFKELRKDMDALEKIGVSKGQIFSALQLRGVAKADIEQIAAGKYVRRFPGNTSIENAINLNLPNFPARIQALRDARDSYPEVQDFLGDE